MLQGMPGITFDAFDGEGPINVGRVFVLLPARARSLTWRASRSFDPVASPTTATLVTLVHNLADEEAALPSDTMARLIDADLQILDGELRGFDDQTDQLDFIVRSVRGDQWDIEARRPEELDQIAAQIPSWSQHPQPIL